MLPAQIMLAFHFMWFDWHYMVTKILVPLALGITNVPPLGLYTILQNLRFGVFTMLPEYPLRYFRMSTAKIGGGSRGGGGDDALSGEETVEKPRRRKIKTPAGNNTGGGGGTWYLIPSREVDETLLCGAANRDRVQVKSMFALVGGPPPLHASDGLSTCWAYHLQGGCSSNCGQKWDHCPSAAEDIGPRREYEGRIWTKL